MSPKQSITQSNKVFTFENKNLPVKYNRNYDIININKINKSKKEICNNDLMASNLEKENPKLIFGEKSGKHVKIFGLQKTQSTALFNSKRRPYSAIKSNQNN